MTHPIAGRMYSSYGCLHSNANRLLIVLLLPVLSGVLSCGSAIAQNSGGFNTDFRRGVAVEMNFRVRDASLSRLATLDAAALSKDTAVTALGVSDDRLVIGTSDRGVFESADNGKSWQHYDVHQVPMRRDAANQRKVYAIDSTARLLTHKHDILLRTDAADKPWQTAKTDMGKGIIFTAIHRGKNNLYLGTSVNGLKVAALSDAQYRNALAGKAPLTIKFKSINTGVPGKPHSKSHFIYEEVTAINELPDGDLLIASGPRPAVHIRAKGKDSFQQIPVNGLSDAFDECRSISATSRERIVLSCDRGVWTGSAANPAWIFTPQQRIQSDLASYGGYHLVDSEGNRVVYIGFKSTLTNEKKQRLQNASGQRIMYASAYTWSKRNAQVISELKNDFWTGLVIDGKDDNGIIRYDSEVPLAKAVGAVRPMYKMADVAQKLHSMGKRLIVRLVIFKDPKLFEREGYAIRDPSGGKWIGTPKERWIDPYNPDLLTEYYAPMMKELTERGVDEIQLDYIRFPSDGAVGRCRFSHKKAIWQEANAAGGGTRPSAPPPDYYYSEALENFLTGVREATHLPLGADIYGYNGMYRVPGAIGQDLEVYGRVLDVIAPMHYSSHFGDDYMRHLPREERTYQLLLLALSRGTYFAHGEFIIRPFIQAFSMKDGLWGYGKKYFADQIRGSADGGGDGFMFWGKLDDMMLVRRTQTQ